MVSTLGQPQFPRKGNAMDKLHGYALLIIAQSATTRTVWHYSTGNDESVCNKSATANSVGYTDTETALKIKGVCYACARYVAKHGDYQGWDSENNVRFLSITNPQPEAHCAIHNKGVSVCADMHRKDNAKFSEGDIVMPIPGKALPFEFATVNFVGRTTVNVSTGSDNFMVNPAWLMHSDDGGFMETEEIPAHLVMHYGASQNACGADSERRTTFFPGVDCDTCLDNARTSPEFLWNAEDIPAGWENGTHRSNSDYDAAMSWPQTFYRGADGQNARMVLVSKLREYATFNHVVQSGESQMHLDAANSIADGAMNVRIHGRIYRIRRGVPVTQTYGKGL